MKKLLLLALGINQAWANDFVFSTENFNDMILSNPDHQKIAQLCQLEAGEIFGDTIIYRLTSNNPVINDMINADIPTREAFAAQMDLSEMAKELDNIKNNEPDSLEHFCGMMGVTSDRTEIKDLGHYQGFIQIMVAKNANSVNGSGVHTREVYVFDSTGKKLSLHDIFNPKAYAQLQSALLPKFLAAKGVKSSKACAKSPDCRMELSAKNFDAQLKKALITENFYFDAQGNLHFVYSYHENEYHQPSPLVNQWNPELELQLAPHEYQSALKK